MAQQESDMGRASSDVMQASEGAGRNITNPLDSFNAGSAELARDLQLANGNIPWALAAYNMGPGILSWAKNNGVSNPKEAMSQFSAYQKNKNGYRTYGDPNYIDHVMRYLDS